jgi:hypothetical protein
MREVLLWLLTQVPRTVTHIMSASPHRVEQREGWKKREKGERGREREGRGAREKREREARDKERRGRR